MGTGYYMMCKECDAISESYIGSPYCLYSSNCVESFVRKHWRCEKDGIKIVCADDYGFVDCRIDDCQPNTTPKWDKIITLTGKALEEEKIWQTKCMERLGINPIEEKGNGYVYND